MTMRELLTVIGLGRIAAETEAGSLPSLRLTSGDLCSLPVTRLGGQPNLPQNVQWPVWSDERPLSFIAQLDLATLPGIPELPLPCSGSLFFFYDAVNQRWGFDPKDKGCAKVIYSPSPLVEHDLCTPHHDLADEALFEGIALTPTLELSFPTTEVFRDFHPTDEEWEAYGRLVEPLNRPVYRMGGHPDQIQGDLRLEAQLVANGLYCGDRSGYDQGREVGLYDGAANWRLLLQVDSEQRTRMYWGDEGRLYFMIHKNDLLQLRFDNVWVILQTT